jgi:hypothetical protein
MTVSGVRSAGAVAALEPTASVRASVAAPTVTATEPAYRGLKTALRPLADDHRRIDYSKEEPYGHQNSARSGPGFAVVSEREGGGQVLIHFSMHLDMTGSFGNAYSVWLYANKAFAAPTANLGGGLVYYDVPVHQVAASTTAPSYTSNYLVRVYVLSGQPVAGVFIGPAMEHCA